ncbi:MAG TPA: sugar-binding protein [Prolixibacteraceae bacterium]|nr:sugar-binding protein [Prolixibacteraceae bacterium]
MKKIYSLLIALLVCGGMFAQTGVNVEVAFTTEPIEIDGFLDEAWDAVAEVAIELPFREEVPTVTSWWKALYDEDYCYVVVNVIDEGNHWPSWESGGNSWEYDKPEVYWDMNEVIADAVGVSVASSGHWQIADGFVEATYDTEIEVAATTQKPGGKIGYSLSGEDYVYEHAMLWSTLLDKNGTAYTAADVRNVLGDIGFDVTIIDQDEGITTARQRAVWQSDGTVDECWNNMDGCGTITLLEPSSSKEVKNIEMSVYPNPASNHVTINAQFTRVDVSNILGQQVKSIAQNSRTLNISDLSKGVYVLKAYNNDKYVGTAKFTKN